MLVRKIKEAAYSTYVVLKAQPLFYSCQQGEYGSTLFYAKLVIQLVL